MTSTRALSQRLATVSLALAATTATALTGTSVAQAMPNPAQLSSQVASSAQFPKIQLPKEAVALSSQFGVPLPDFIAQPGTGGAFASERAQLQSKTVAHLRQTGHREDPGATRIAQEWADQGAAGKLTFISGSQRGLTHNDKGTGSVKKLTRAQAVERIKWLSRTANKTPNPQRFGVATATDGTFVYVAEYFYN